MEEKLILEVFQFKIHNYPVENIPVSFGPINYTKNNKCGKIYAIPENISNHEDQYLRSCDLIESIFIGGGTNISDFYNIYLKGKAKQMLNDVNRKEIYTKNHVRELINLVEEATECNKKYITSKLDIDEYSISEIHNGCFIYNLRIKNKKIVVFGDIHGSFHTIFRCIMRLFKMNIIENIDTLKLVPGYMIIFLGDVIDRGYYSVEILSIICKLIVSNNKEEQNVILNRGNHEHIGIFTMYGFSEEIKNKFKDIPTNLYEKYVEKIYNFFSYSSSAVILNYPDISKKIWLCHGGIPCIDEEINLSDDIIFYKNTEHNNISHQIKWNDFSYDKHKIYSLNKTRKCSPSSMCFKIHPMYLKRFMNTYGINFIIRGHQDNFSNAYIFGKINLSLDKLKVDHNSIQIGEKMSDKITTKTAIAYIDISNWNEKSLYPVLVVSTNTDNLRNLTSDSFVIINFN